MSQQISKSPEFLAKEAAIKKLQSQLKKKKTRLKGLKTRLQNTKEAITKIQREGTGKVMSMVSKMETLRVELVDLVKKVLKIKGIDREDKEVLKTMEQSFAEEELFGDGFKQMKEEMDEMESGDFDFNFDEQTRAKMRDMFEQFTVKPDEKEQKNIRKIFIRLSQKFHPDKATTEKDAEEYHGMMQKINEAYQAGDIHTLLELEQLFLMEELDLTKVQSLTVDVLQQEIDRLERDLAFIEGQINRNNQELKSLRASDLGQMLKDIKKAEKAGQGIDDMTREMQESMDKLQQVKEGLEHSLEIKGFSPKLMEFFIESSQSQNGFEDEMKAMLMDMMGDSDIDMEDLGSMFGGFGDDFEEERLQNPNPRFKEDSYVKIKRGLHPLDEKTDMKGMVGRIEDAFIEEDGTKVYEVELDSISMAKLPSELVAEAVSVEVDFQNVEVIEQFLEKTNARESKRDAVGGYRTQLHNHLWVDSSKEIQETLKKILLYKPNLADYENWVIHLDKVLNFPIEVRSRGFFNIRKGEKLQILECREVYDSAGVIVEVRYKDQRDIYPLVDLVPTRKTRALKPLFDAYFDWVNETCEF